MTYQPVLESALVSLIGAPSDNLPLDCVMTVSATLLTYCQLQFQLAASEKSLTVGKSFILALAI